MDIFPPLVKQQENGLKFLAATSRGDELRLCLAELQRMMIRVGEGHLEVTIGFGNRSDQIGNVGRSFNCMVDQLRENREEVERLHRAQMSRAERLATPGQ